MTLGPYGRCDKSQQIASNVDKKSLQKKWIKVNDRERLLRLNTTCHENQSLSVMLVKEILFIITKNLMFPKLKFKNYF